MTDSVAHAALMDRTYRYQRRFYDLTRRYFLFGRDRLIAGLAPPPHARVLEIACGTGRNLARIRRRYPHANLYGLDISRQMLLSAEATLRGRATLALADATRFDGGELFGIRRFDRIVLSYSLSMIPDWQGALRMALRHVAPGGELHIVDFGGQSGLPSWFRGGLRMWLAKFHVAPRDGLATELALASAEHGASVEFGALWGDYAHHAVVRMPAAVAKAPEMRATEPA